MRIIALRRKFAALAVCCLIVVLNSAARSADSVLKPNIVLILADDLGWTDLACYGSKLYETPNIDQLARDGMKFTQNYSGCTVCSPTRASLLTGKYPARLHITDWIPGQMPDNPKLIVPDWTKYLPLEETTIANVLHDAGYATTSLGKWHLGGEKYYPDKHGFDFFLAGTDKPNTKHYFSPYGIPTLPDGPKGEYVTDRLTDESIRFIDANKEQAVLPLFAPLRRASAAAGQAKTDRKISGENQARRLSIERHLRGDDRQPRPIGRPHPPRAQEAQAR